MSAVASRPQLACPTGLLSWAFWVFKVAAWLGYLLENPPNIFCLPVIPGIVGTRARSDFVIQQGWHLKPLIQ